MIISRTPLRLSFLGGGTDYVQWYLEHEGAVLATTIDKYCYVILHDGRSSRFFDLPTKAGLASSSAYTVGLLRACTDLDCVTISKLATTWEQDKMNGNVGSQDQYLCAVGGFHLLKFYEYGIKDTPVPTEIAAPLQDYLMLFDTHQYRLASSVVAHQLEHIKEHEALLTRMAKMAEEGLGLIKTKDYANFGSLLDIAWQNKKQLSDHVSTPTIDAIYDSAIKAGALGGKILGGGGGGFMVFFVEPEKQEGVKNALSDLSLYPFRFENEGSKVIYHD